MPHAAVSERQRSRAKQLRQTMTRAETLLWRYADQTRDAFFAAQGFQVLRFTNQQVTSNLEGVMEVIRQAASSRANGSPPSLTLPHKGGGNGEGCADIVENTSNTRGQP